MRSSQFRWLVCRHLTPDFLLRAFMGEAGHLGDRQLDCRGSNSAEQTLHTRGMQVASIAGAHVPRATSRNYASGATSIVLSVAPSCGSHPWCSGLSRTPAVLFGERRAVLSEHLGATPGALRRCPESEPEVRRAEWGLAGAGSSDLGCGGAAVGKPGLAADQAHRVWGTAPEPGRHPAPGDAVSVLQATAPYTYRGWTERVWCQDGAVTSHTHNLVVGF